MKITYQDDLGYVIEDVDQYGISCDGHTLIFNDKRVDCSRVEFIQEDN